MNTWELEVPAGLVAAAWAHSEAIAETLEAAAAHPPLSPAQLEANADLTLTNAGLH